MRPRATENEQRSSACTVSKRLLTWENLSIVMPVSPCGTRRESGFLRIRAPTALLTRGRPLRCR
jgi:hypothetical protein